MIDARRALAGLLFSLMALPALAVGADEILPDAAQESRARALSSELRCLVCQNQSIDDSDAPLARDLRLLVRERIKSGDSDASVRAFLVERYGEFVLLKPPLAPHTLLLWMLPFLALGGGLLALSRRAGHAQRAAVPLSDAEKAELQRALASAKPGRKSG